MELSDREKDLLAALSATTKSAVSIFVPGLSQAISGWDAYKQSQHNRNVSNMLRHLEEKVDDLQTLFKSEWLQTEEGKLYSCKVVDSALDVQLEDKQELFVNAFINGIRSSDYPNIEKLKFVDMLRHLSLSSLIILSEMDKMFEGRVRRPNANTDPISAYPQVDAESIAEQLSGKYDPYLVTAAVRELESEGLFSKIGEWKRNPTGGYFKGGGFLTELCYTDFTARFADFIKNPEQHVT